METSDNGKRYTFNLNFERDKGTKVLNLAGGSGATSGTVARGTAVSGYANQPMMWLRTLLDAAKENLFFNSIAKQLVLPPGNADLVFPYRTMYLTESEWTENTAENTEGTYTKMDTADGITFTPADKSINVAMSNRAMRINAFNLVGYAREEMAYKYARMIDKAISDALVASTAATSSVRGTQIIYGGEKTSNATLADGDVITTDLVNKARRMLMSKDCYDTTTHKSSAEKNPWMSEKNAPFVLFISEYQAETLLNDPYFTNAADYGSNVIKLNGELGSFPHLGIKVVSSTRTPGYTNWGAGSPGTTSGHMCMLVKSQFAIGLAWGLKPRFHVFDYPSKLETRMIMEVAFQAKMVHDDAVVKIDVTDV